MNHSLAQAAKLRLLNSDARPGATVICFSHLRWDFVFQRPQHLMARFAKNNRVIFWEEPEYFADPECTACLDIRTCAKTGVIVARPELPAGISPEDMESSLRGLLDILMTTETGPLVRWYYTPMMHPFSRHIAAKCIVYDCMDALANFKNAPPELLSREDDLMEAADLVFTGGYSLYEAMRHRHDNIHAFPSSVDVGHFNSARMQEQEPEDQAHLPHPRLGYYGVIDERMDIDLLDHLARARPDWSIVLIGPVVKIDPASLPRHSNIHWLGSKDYGELPAYLGGWEVALMPFAINEATRFISPTKTPEYLAGGCPVVSTPIADVVRHYGDVGAVRIAASPDAFVEACDALLALRRESNVWRDQADVLLADMSWDKTFTQMAQLIAARMKRPQSWSRPVSTRRDGTHYDRHSPSGLPLDFKIA